MPVTRLTRQGFFDELTHCCDGSFAVLIIGRPGISKARFIRDWAQTISIDNHFFVTDELAQRLKERDSEPVQLIGRRDLLANFPYQESVFDSNYRGTGNREQLIENLQEELEKSAFLVLDDLDYVPFSTQVQLFDFLSTDSFGNNLTLKDEQGTQVILPQIIAMVNHPLSEIYAHPDRHYRLLFERLAQQVFYLPEIRDYTRAEKEEAFLSVWNDLHFVDRNRQNVDFSERLEPNERKLLFDWIDSLRLEGNYRDLQVIAIGLRNELIRPNPAKGEALIAAVSERYEVARFASPTQSDPL